MNTELNNLLLDCLNQFQALDNACTFTRSFELRNRLRAALNLPLEVVEEVPEMALCPGCGGYVDACHCGNYPPDGWESAAPMPLYEVTPDDLRLPALAERLADSIRDDRH